MAWLLFSWHILLTFICRWYRNHEHDIVHFVVDECHQIITCNGFRKHFNAVKELAQYLVQKVFLSATIPVYLEAYFLEQTYLPLSTKIIRQQTNRINLSYHVLQIDNRIHQSIKDWIVCLTHLLEETIFNSASRGIIFCLSRQEVDDIAMAFGNTKSHSDMDSQDRAQIQEEWFQGMGTNRQWMVATTTFIHGIDHPNVDAVIFVELPFGLMNFVQGAGRAGRGGQSAYVFLLNYCMSFIEPHHSDPLDPIGVVPGNQFARNGDMCRRKILSQTMDGISVSCTDIGGLECDICKQDHPLVVGSRRLLDPPRDPSPDYDMGPWDDETIANLDESYFMDNPTSHAATCAQSHPPPIASASNPSMSLQLDHAHYMKLIADKHGKVQELTAMTNFLCGYASNSDFRGYCIICWAWKKKLVQRTADHRFFLSCKSKEDHFVKHAVGWIQEVKKKFSFDRFAYCYMCGLPQGEFAPSSHPSFRKGEVINCPFDDLVAVLVWHIIHHDVTWKKAIQAFPGLTANMPLSAIVEWACKEEQPHLFYNGLELVIWYWVTHKQQTV